MRPDDDWNLIRGSETRLADAQSSAIKMALLFGSAAIALALVVTSMLDGIGYRSQSARNGFPSGLDLTATGSVNAGASTYTIRRSVLQPTPTSVCVIRADGSRIGEC